MSIINEEWVTHGSGLKISNLGRVLFPSYYDKSNRHHKERVTFGCKNKKGYMQVRWKGKIYKVHRLICEAFHPNPNNYKEVDHIDRNPSNNRADNLRWADRKIQNHNRGITYSEIGEINRKNLSKKVLQLNKDTLEIIKVWDSTVQASKELKLNGGGIRACCANHPQHKTCGGYVFRYR